MRELAWDPRVEHTHLDVAVVNGIVTLTGTVHSWPEKEAILGVAGHALGVRELVDNLPVDPSS